MAHYHADVLRSGLKAVFCGLNPATSAVAAGFNFSSSSNRFWSVLFRSGFTDVHLQPEEERHLLDYGYGITAVVERPTKRAEDVQPEEFRRARPRFERKMRRYAPRAIGFLGKRAFLEMVGMADVAWGRQPTEFAGAAVWILPNPSGRNRSFTLNRLVNAYSEFRVALEI